MRLNSAVIILLSTASMATAFRGPISGKAMRSYQKAETILPETAPSRPIYDPMGLYPESSEEKQQGKIRPLEPKLEVTKPVLDPMGLYPIDSQEYRDAMKLEAQQSTGGSPTSRRPIFDPMGLYPESSKERKESLIGSMEPEVKPENYIRDPMGLYPKDSSEFEASLALERESLVSKNADLYDPLGLYPGSSEERQNGRIKPLEDPDSLNVIKPVTDPLGLYSPEQKEAQVDEDAIMSEALPFATRPVILDGELAGDVGFDPLGFAKSKESLYTLREAEIKHARLAMLAAAGWPLAELWDKKLAALAHLKPLLVDGDRVPSILNGGLSHVNPFYWMGALVLASFVEVLGGSMQQDKLVSVVPGDLNFDPLGLYPADVEGQKNMQLAEIKNGRLAMIAITAFALIEAVTKASVVSQTPFLFHPPF